MMTRRAFLSAGAASALAPALASPTSSRRAAPRAEAGRWRDDFPVLAASSGDRPLAYLDSAATTQKPNAVIDAVADFYRRTNANPSPAMHRLAREAQEQFDAARRTVAAFVHAADPFEIVWTKGTTEAINLVAASWGANLTSGDEILLTEVEHYSNLLPWRAVAKARGASIRYAAMDDEGRVSAAAVERALTRRTKIVAFTHVSNVIGYPNPAKAICAAAHRAGAKVLVDAAQSVPHFAVDVQDLGCDFLAFSSHKMVGPMGVGVLWARRDLLDAMPPYQSGSNMAHEVDETGQHYEIGALKFGAGTPNVSGPIGLAAAVRYIEAIGYDALRAHEHDIAARMIQRLGAVPGLRLLGPRDPDEKVSVFSFALPNVAPGELVQRLDGEGIAIRGGDLAALPLLKRFGLSTAARASCYLYTTLDDVDRLGDALRRIAAGAV